MPIETVRPSSPLHDLKEYFECPVCYVVPREPPIFTCAVGHMICATCRPKVLLCPICRDTLGNQRLLFAERLLDHIPVPCKFAEEGCTVELNNADMGRHEPQCEYRPVKCENAECKARLTARQAKSHRRTCEFRLVRCPFPNCDSHVAKSCLEEHVDLHTRGKYFQTVLLLLLLSVLGNIILFSKVLDF